MRRARGQETIVDFFQKVRVLVWAGIGVLVFLETIVFTQQGNKKNG